MTERSIEVVLFDLDGTISDSAPGILAALRHAFAVNGLQPLDAATERAILGPPFYESLPPLIGTAELQDVIDAYRARYKQTMYQTRSYEGVPELLQRLHASGCTLAVATSKPERYAEPIVEHLGLAGYFAVIGGDSTSGDRPTKADVIGHVLRQLGDPDPVTVTMVGDRRHDVEGARAHDIESIGVRWGYAQPGELDVARPRAIAADIGELAQLLRTAHAAAS